MKKELILLFLCVAEILSCSAQENTKIYKKVGNTTIYDVENKSVFYFISGMSIDADGSPKAYNKNNEIALDNLSNAGKSGNWWALATDNKKISGNPLIQKSTDPHPGYYISMTSLQDKSKDYSDPKRYVNSEDIPYVVLPSKFSNEFKLGDIALVVNKKNGRKAFAIFADTGPKDKIGEGSIKLAKELGLISNPKNGGTPDDILYVLYKNSGRQKVLTLDSINIIGKTKFTEVDVLYNNR